MPIGPELYLSYTKRWYVLKKNITNYLCLVRHVGNFIATNCCRIQTLLLIEVNINNVFPCVRILFIFSSYEDKRKNAHELLIIHEEIMVVFSLFFSMESTLRQTALIS